MKSKLLLLVNAISLAEFGDKKKENSIVKLKAND